MAGRIQIFFESSGIPAAGELYQLSPEDSHHLVRVLRVNVGQEISAVEKNSGTRFKAIITNSSTPTTIRLAAMEGSEAAPPPAYRLILPAIKGQRMEWILEKATELGVEEIIIFHAERSVSRPEFSKVERWNRICEAAASQSARSSLPQLQLVESLSSALLIVAENKKPDEGRICCSLSPASRPLKEAMGLHATFSVTIGPEGDFTAEEEALFQRNGFALASLGERILRSDTAAIVALSMVNALGSAS